MPPDHGAAIANMILNDAELKASWMAELNEMSARIRTLREHLVSAFRAATASDRFDYLTSHKGLFSLTGLKGEQITRLRHDHGIYLVPEGRMNVAGLRESDIESAVKAFIAVGAGGV